MTAFSLNTLNANYISLDADWHKWSSYVFTNKDMALKLMADEIATINKPNVKFAKRVIYALLKQDNPDYYQILEIFKKIMKPFRYDSQYIFYYLSILKEINHDKAYSLALSYLKNNNREILSIAAELFNKRKTIFDIIQLNHLPEIQGDLLDLIFRKNYPNSQFLEELLFSLNIKDLSLWAQQIYVKWLNIHKYYTDADLIKESIGNTDISDYPKYNKNRSLLLSPSPDTEIGSPLLITFSGFSSDIVNKHYFEHGISHLDLLYNTRDFEVKHLFANLNINLLHVLDEFQVWGLFHIPQNIYEIKKIIYALKPSKIITFGCSAGGFSSLLYGQLLHADLSIAIVPQIVAFHDFMNSYRIKLCEKFRFNLHTYAFIPRILRLDKNSKPIYKSIYYSENNKQDSFHANLLTGDDNNIDLNPLNLEDTHDLFGSIGKEAMRKMIFKDLSKYCNIIET